MKENSFGPTPSSLTISILPHDLTFVDWTGPGLLDFMWDGSPPYRAYRYKHAGGKELFPEDPTLGHAFILGGEIRSLDANITNSTSLSRLAVANVRIYEVFNAQELKFHDSKRAVIPAYSEEKINIFDAMPLTSLSVSDPGTYRVEVSVVDESTGAICDTCSILFRVATPTPTGSSEVQFPDSMGSVTFGSVTGHGNTNIVEIDASGTETGDIQVLGKAYSIHTTATFEGDVTISIHYDDSGLTLSQESNLKMYKVVDTPWWNWWEDRIDITQSVDTITNVITGRTDTLSTFLSGYEVGIILEGKLINHGPNPVPAEGCIFWLDLPDDAMSATLKLFDIDGTLLVSIPLDAIADRYPAAGRWIPEDDQGRLLGTGLYLYLVGIEHTDGTVTYSPVQKMVIQR